MNENTIKSVETICQEMQDQAKTHWVAYSHIISTLAESYFGEYVEPLCKKRGWDFVSSKDDDTWELGPYDEISVLTQKVEIDPDDTELVIALSVLFHRFPGLSDVGSLGVLVNSFTPQKQENKETRSKTDES